MPVPRKDPCPAEAPSGERPYRGWTWRGAELTDRQLAVFLPGRVLKHLGIPVLRLGRPTAWPIRFAVYAHRGWRRGQQVALPADACFEVWAVRPLPGGGRCVVLEQLDEEDCAPAAFRRSLEAWLQRHEGPGDEPGEDERHDAAQPFARWLPAARRGSPPLQGPSYDFEEAVRYASAWSGLEERLTWRILAAPTRPLDGVGLAAPDVGPEEAEAAASRGELAYLDHLGILSWASAEQREERLGTPAWPLAGAMERGPEGKRRRP